MIAREKLKHIVLVMILLWVNYYVCTQFFTHSHYFNQHWVTHSHPYQSATHTHSTIEFELIQSCSTTLFPTVSAAFFEAPVAILLWIIIAAIETAVVFHKKNVVALRAPPYLLSL